MQKGSDLTTSYIKATEIAFQQRIKQQKKSGGCHSLVEDRLYCIKFPGLCVSVEMGEHFNDDSFCFEAGKTIKLHHMQTWNIMTTFSDEGGENITKESCIV